MTSCPVWFAKLSLLSPLAALFLYAAFASPGDPDLGYHLTIGYLLLESATIPRLDTFRFDSQAPEIAYSWLPDLSLALVERLWGVAGLHLWVVCSVVFLALIAISIIFNRQTTLYSALALVVASLSFLVLCSPRPQVWGIILFGALLLVLRPQPVESFKPPLRWRLLWTTAIVALWANTHISVLVAPIVIALVCGAYAIHKVPEYNWQSVGILVIASLLAVMINPYGPQLFSFYVAFSPTTLDHIAPQVMELRGLLEFNWPFPLWYIPSCCLSLVAIFVGISRIVRGGLATISAENGYYVGALLLVLLFGWLSITSMRYVGFLALSSLFALTSPRQSCSNTARFASICGLFVFMLATFVGYTQAKSAKNWYEPQIALRPYPLLALTNVKPNLQHLNSRGQRWRILAPFGAGHFVTWWLHQHDLSSFAALFVDGRLDVLGQERFVIAQKIYREPYDTSLLDVYAIDIVFVAVDNPLYRKLSKDPSWKVVPADRMVALVRS